MNQSQREQQFVSAIWQWYGRHKRSLPWRDMTIEDPTERAYRVLVSEIMLQQTQVSRVQIVFKNFLEKFPTLHDLANATNADVILAWRGMGYNSRALRLRDAAKTVVQEFDGVFPSDHAQLLSLKGIGHYTAGAICNFAFNIPTPCIDTNIRRVLHRTFFGLERIDDTWEKSDTELLKLAESVLHKAIACPSCNDDIEHSGREWHAALMDFGSMIQTKSNPKWEICPLTTNGVMKATTQDWEERLQQKSSFIKQKKQEPGRMEGATYVPNRIFRGRVVEALRDAEQGLTLEEIGPRISFDWNTAEHHKWLETILEKLAKDTLIQLKKSKYVLSD